MAYAKCSHLGCNAKVMTGKHPMCSRHRPAVKQGTKNRSPEALAAKARREYVRRHTRGINTSWTIC